MTRYGDSPTCSGTKSVDLWNEVFARQFICSLRVERSQWLSLLQDAWIEIDSLRLVPDLETALARLAVQRQIEFHQLPAEEQGSGADERFRATEMRPVSATTGHSTVVSRASGGASGPIQADSDAAASLADIEGRGTQKQRIGTDANSGIESASFPPALGHLLGMAMDGGALTSEQVQAWFDHFRSDNEIPWNYANDCCYNRAHVMATKLLCAGLPVGKAWNYASDWIDGASLRVNTLNDPKGYVEWSYHVAPTVPVRQQDGSAQDMVVDPSISDRPLTPAEWKALQSQPTSNLVLTSSDPYYRSESGQTMPTPTDEQVKQIFEKHRARRDALWRDGSLQ